MTLDLGRGAAGATGATSTDLVKDSSTATFQADVLDASKSVPVLVDFWAPWCGPCKQLGPLIEKVVASYAGKIKLSKINVDENQQLAGQMGVQSIPAVFAFVGGQPVDGFMGALPETQIRAFVDKVLAGAKNLDSEKPAADPGIENALEAAQLAVESNDLERAEQIYSAILQHDSTNDRALFGIAEVFLKSERLDDATLALENVSEAGKKLPVYATALSSVVLAREAQSLGSVAELEARLSANENDHQARYDLALALNAKGFKFEAAEALVQLMRKDRTWNDDAARVKLLELFEAWGPTDPTTLKGRRLLSAVLFS